MAEQKCMGSPGAFVLATRRRKGKVGVWSFYTRVNSICSSRVRIVWVRPHFTSIGAGRGLALAAGENHSFATLRWCFKERFASFCRGSAHYKTCDTAQEPHGEDEA
jgi:hypothetical protein